MCPKNITIIGTGIGAGTMTAEALEAVGRAEVLLGSPRMLEIFSGTSKPAYPEYLPNDVAARIRSENAGEFAVLVSGDVGFYSAAASLCEALDGYPIRLIPGISVVSAFFAKLGLPWQDAAFVSAHGRKTNVVDAVRRSRMTFCLTGDNVCKLGAALDEAGFGGAVTYVGENLGLGCERIYKTKAEALICGTFPSLTVLLFVNEDFDNRTASGLADSIFSRVDGIPMTKSEIRAVVMSKLRLRPDFICYDIGAGTGSVTAEMALSAYYGQVYAIERRGDAIPLINQNCRSLHIGNVTVICGHAPDALRPLPAPDAVFIGGNGGEPGAIINAVLEKNRKTRIVMTAVTLESVTTGLKEFNNAGLEPEIVQVSVARAKAAGGMHLMEAQNPVTILSAGGKL